MVEQQNIKEEVRAELVGRVRELEKARYGVGLMCGGLGERTLRDRE